MVETCFLIHSFLMLWAIKKLNLLLHTKSHSVFDHLGLAETIEIMLYNIVADYKVNNTLVRDLIGEKSRL